MVLRRRQARELPGDLRLEERVAAPEVHQRVGEDPAAARNAADVTRAALPGQGGAHRTDGAPASQRPLMWGGAIYSTGLQACVGVVRSESRPLEARGLGTSGGIAQRLSLYSCIFPAMLCDAGPVKRISATIVNKHTGVLLVIVLKVLAESDDVQSLHVSLMALVPG